MHLHAPLDVAPFSRFAMSPPTLNHSSDLSTPSRSQSPSVDFASIRTLVRDLLPSSRSLQQLERFPARLHIIYLLHLRDGSHLVLKCPPSPRTRVLRCENFSLANESTALGIFTSMTSCPFSVPEVIRYESASTTIGTPYLLRTHVGGTPLRDLAGRLASTHRDTIDQSLGYFLRFQSSLTGPSFGPLVTVNSGRGARTWREAFMLLLESILRDAEDMLIALPYDMIRSGIQAKISALDQVSTPRLVALDAGRPENVIIDSRTNNINGLVGWGATIWGDPLLAAVFWFNDVENIREAFWQGLGRQNGVGQAAGEVERLQIYAVFRAAYAVVSQYYRPAQEELQELEGRRCLTRALSELQGA
ncbi:hypothetical protein HDK77DRAFT_80691 [Phyllosticta capitalensis]|uniref:Aminoglycoside phosphotransferase domain-containing protein n=2 Tax=Phyllosticta capitalensis TaxID=121624 RepID=A0ABR1YDV4_9PEZI